MSIDEELGLGKSDGKSSAGKPPGPSSKPQRTIPPDPRTARPPAPTSKEGGGSAWIIVLALLLVGGRSDRVPRVRYVRSRG